MGGHEIADAVCRFASGFDGRFDAADIALDDGCDQCSADGDGFDQLHIRGLDHCVTGFHQADIAAGFE